MFNVVKVESVPLNFNEFSRRGTIGQVHVAVVASSAASHMHPHLAVVAELVRRGHRGGTPCHMENVAQMKAATSSAVCGCTTHGGCCRAASGKNTRRRGSLVAGCSRKVHAVTEL
jgi:hypothetical protein